MRWVPKIRVKLFRLSFSTGSASRKNPPKKVDSKKPFFDCVRKLDLGFSRKRPFSTDKSDCIRNGLRGVRGSRPSRASRVLRHARGQFFRLFSTFFFCFGVAVNCDMLY